MHVCNYYYFCYRIIVSCSLNYFSYDILLSSPPGAYSLLYRCFNVNIILKSTWYFKYLRLKFLCLLLSSACTLMTQWICCQRAKRDWEDISLRSFVACQIGEISAFDLALGCFTTQDSPLDVTQAIHFYENGSSFSYFLRYDLMNEIFRCNCDGGSFLGDSPCHTWICLSITGLTDKDLTSGYVASYWLPHRNLEEPPTNSVICFCCL